MPLLTCPPERLRAAGADQALRRAEVDALDGVGRASLDEPVDLLGRDKPTDQAAERERKEEAPGVLDILIGREDLMDNEDTDQADQPPLQY